MNTKCFNRPAIILLCDNRSIHFYKVSFLIYFFRHSNQSSMFSFIYSLFCFVLHLKFSLFYTYTCFYTYFYTCFYYYFYTYYCTYFFTYFYYYFDTYFYYYFYTFIYENALDKPVIILGGGFLTDDLRWGGGLLCFFGGI